MISTKLISKIFFKLTNNLLKYTTHITHTRSLTCLKILKVNLRKKNLKMDIYKDKNNMRPSQNKYIVCIKTKLIF